MFDGDPFEALADVILYDPPLMYACRRCDALVGERCVTRGGNRVAPGHSHGWRWSTWLTCDGSVFPVPGDTRGRKP